MAALAAILIPSSLTAQITFERTYGGADADWGCCARQTSNSGYVIVGSTRSFGAGSDDVYLVKVNARGETLWTRTYGGAGRDQGESMQQTLDSGYIIAGWTSSCGAGARDVYLVRLDANGDTMWTKAFGGKDDDVGVSVQQTADGGYIIVGTTYSFGAGNEDVYLIKTNAGGDTLWTRTFGGASRDEGYSVEQTADSGYIITGYTESFGAGRSDVWLVKTDALGDTLWTRTYGGSNTDLGLSVRPTADSGYVVAGWTSSHGAGVDDFYLIKTDVDGDTVWTKTFGGSDCDRGYSVLQTADGGYIVTGLTTSFGAGARDVYLVRTDSTGNTRWARTFGGILTDEGNSVHLTADGGFIVTGITYSFGAGASDVYLIKTDSLGNVAVAEPKANPARASNLTIACQPNPATGATTIRLSPFALRHSPLTLRVYDAQGKLALSQPVRTSSFPLSTSDLPSGAYFIRCDFAGQHATTRLILQR
jgi:hypothetical protein